MSDPTDIVERLNAGGHLDCEDGYYACPQAEGYFGEYAGTDECFCDLPLRREAATEIGKLRKALEEIAGYESASLSPNPLLSQVRAIAADALSDD
jgi:hypothetical protein